MTTFGERIAFLCETAGGSREDLSALCELSRAYLGMLVRGERHDMMLTNAVVVCRVFGCSLEWLATGHGAAPSARALARAVAARREAFPISPKRRIKA